VKKKSSPFAKLAGLRDQLPSVKGVVGPAPSQSVPTPADQPSSFAEWMSVGKRESKPRADEPAPEIVFAFSSDRARAYRIGQPEHLDALASFPIQDALELHGLSSESARERVAKFVRGAQVKRERVVLLIHGKGQHSPGREGILRTEVRDWLTGQLADAVLAFAPAPANEGGSGATMVLLELR
jgi:DNA-nicking Smr family endonuclease